MDKKPLAYLIKWTLALAVFWLLLSGYLKPLLLFFGLVSVALVVYLIHRMDKIDTERQKPAINIHFTRYLVWLLSQVILSSVEVAKLVWGKPKDLDPAVDKLPLDKIPKKSRVLYANSITLTPGTLSIDLDDKYVTVHALHRNSIQELRHGEMANKVYTGSGRRK